MRPIFSNYTIEVLYYFLLQLHINQSYIKGWYRRFMMNLAQGSNNQKGALTHTTNQVLISSKGEKITYYLPCYVRLKVKSINELDVDNLKGVVSGTLLFAFYYGNLPESILQQFTSNEEGSKAVTLQLERQSSIELREGTQITLKQSRKDRILDYIVRTEFNCNLEGDVFFTPFEIFNLHLTITAQAVVLDPKQNDGRNIEIKFNCMDSEKVHIIDSQPLSFGRYALAGYFLHHDVSNKRLHRFAPVQVTNKDKLKPKENKVQKEQNGVACFKGVQDNSTNLTVVNRFQEEHQREQKFKGFQYSHFRIPMYQYPVSSLLEIFIPLWILAAINLGIYFQDSNVLADKIAGIATVTLALIAFIPTINEKIPQTSMVKLIQIIIYLQVFTTFLTLLDSVVVRKKDPAQYETNTATNGFFVITLLINICCVVIILGLLILHKCWWQKVYTKKRKGQDDKQKKGDLVKSLWENKDCDKEFLTKFLTQKVAILGPEQGMSGMQNQMVNLVI